MKAKRGTLIVFTGPSGVGKGTILNEFRNLGNEYYFSVSAATRAPRPGEIDGVNYRFMSVTEFERLIAENKLLEYAKYVDNYYGTPSDPVFENLENGVDVILEIETEGAMQIRNKCPEAVLVFIAPPSIEELRRRLSGRGTESSELVEKRMNAALSELNKANLFDYIIVNDIASEAALDLQAIIRAEKCKMSNITR